MFGPTQFGCYFKKLVQRFFGCVAVFLLIQVSRYRWQLMSLRIAGRGWNPWFIAIWVTIIFVYHCLLRRWQRFSPPAQSQQAEDIVVKVMWPQKRLFGVIIRSTYISPIHRLRMGWYIKEIIDWLIEQQAVIVSNGENSQSWYQCACFCKPWLSLEFPYVMRSKRTSLIGCCSWR